MRSARWFGGVLILGLAAGQVAAEEAPRDQLAIRWFLPDEFDKAREASRKQNRLFIMKGIAFGVDAAGARCATEGCW